MSDTTLIVDGNAVCYSAYYTAGELSYKQQGTGVIYGFFGQLYHVCTTFDISKLVFCWDSRQSHRKRIFPGYKSNRKKTDPDLLRCLKQFGQLRKDILPRLGFANNFHATGYEADDIIASLCMSKAAGDRYVIMSGDHDLYQLLTDEVSLFGLGKRCMYTVRTFTAEYGVSPRLWHEVKALAGCTTDAVPGIPGIGEKRAIDYLLHRASAKICSKIDNDEAQAIRARNLALVRLPFAGTPQFALSDDTPSIAEWLALCDELGFQSFLEHVDGWQRIFSGMSATERVRSKLHKRGSGMAQNRAELPF